MTRRAHPVPRLDPDIARLAGALAELARRAGISAATASGHLRRLIDHQRVAVDRDDPTRRVRLAGPAVGELLESIAAHAVAAGPRAPRR